MRTREGGDVKVRLFIGVVFLGIVLLALGGFTVRRSRRAIRAALRPVQPRARQSGAPAHRPVYA
jgi:hypothetical protein